MRRNERERERDRETERDRERETETERERDRERERQRQREGGRQSQRKVEIRLNESSTTGHREAMAVIIRTQSGNNHNARTTARLKGDREAMTACNHKDRVAVITKQR